MQGSAQSELFGDGVGGMQGSAHKLRSAGLAAAWVDSARISCIAAAKISPSEAVSVFFIGVVGGVVVEVLWCAALICVVGVVGVGVGSFATHRLVVGVVVVEGVWFAALVGDVVWSVLEGQCRTGVEVIVIVVLVGASSVLVLSRWWFSL